HDLELAVAHELGKEKHRDGRGAEHRSFRVPDHLGKITSDVGVGGEHDLVVRPQKLRHAPLEFAFVKLRVAESNGKGVEAIAGELANDGGDGGRINAAAQIGAHRHVCAQADFRRVNQ